MQIFVKTIEGKTITIELGDEPSVGDLMKVIHDKEGIPPNQQRLSYGGKQLDDEDQELGFYHVMHITVDLSLRLCGGMPTALSTLNQ